MLVAEQLEFGYRYPGSAGHGAVQGWIEKKLDGYGWSSHRQEFSYHEVQLANIIAVHQADSEPFIVLGAHYDTRPIADREDAMDPEPVLGANDGASGVAVLLELARSVDPEELRCQIQLVFFDAEDSGAIEGWDWILGSSYYVTHLEAEPDAVVIVDMVGDQSLELPKEKNSTDWLQEELWSIGRELGYDAFMDRPGYSILDDHTPFLQAGIPAVDIIDFNYPYWHTERDTLDKVSAESLETVGRTLQVWLDGRCGNNAGMGRD
ncbi:MAG: M28 family peptidase [Anaerolineales bacterium]